MVIWPKAVLRECLQGVAFDTYELKSDPMGCGSGMAIRSNSHAGEICGVRGITKTEMSYGRVMTERRVRLPGSLGPTWLTSSAYGDCHAAF
jgi:hypothetical protein